LDVICRDSRTADLTAVQTRLQRLEIGVEATVEGQQHAGVGEIGRAGPGAIKVLVDRLLAEDRLAGPRSADAVVQMGVGRTGDDDAGDRRVVHGFIERQDRRVPFRRQGGRRIRHRIDDPGQRQAVIQRRVAGVDATDTARANQGDLMHGTVLRV
jgi:hypothetical protein